MKVEVKQAKDVKEVKKPCEWTCPKCGGDDVNRKHAFAGDEVERGYTNRKEFSTPHADFGYWQADIKLECILHYCRTCCFEWTTEVLALPDSPAETEQPKEKTYTREEVAKVLCPYCRDWGLASQKNRGRYYHSGQDCSASDWLKATGGEE